MQPTVKRWIYLAAGLILLVSAAFWTAPLNAMRVDNKLVAASIELDANPNQALSVMMAVARAPVLEYFWLRATKLKEEGRFFDALQLSEWICKLEPRFAAVWAFNAWNMSYNISVTLNSAEERWRWVKNGIALLRDKAIPANPHNTQLYKELAWIYFHKIADFMDEKHWYYKNEFALMMEDILGPGGEYDWQGLAAAPADWETLVREPGVANFVKELKLLHHDVSQPGVMLGLVDQREAARAQTQPAETPPYWSVFDNPAFHSALKKVEYFWRARRLRDEVKIDPKRVIELLKQFGPLDFRMAEAHALYWANTGVKKGRYRGLRLDPEMLNTDRINIFCLQNMYRRGRMFLSPEARKGVPPLLVPDSRFIEPYFNACIDISKRYHDTESDKTALVSENFDSGFKNFLRDAITQLFEQGDRADAQHYFDWMREHYPQNDFDHGLDYFVDHQLKETLKVLTTHQAIDQMAALIDRALSLFAYGRDREGLTYLRIARQVSDSYNDVTSRPELHMDFERTLNKQIELAKAALPPEMYQRLVEKFNLAKASASQPSRTP